MKNSEERRVKPKSFEFRFYLLGTKGVGITSIIKRFKILNSTKTIVSKDDFMKVFIIDEITISLRFYKTFNPDPIQFDENVNEEDEFVNKTHKLNFKKINKQLATLLNDQTYYNYDLKENFKIFHCFLFCFDLSNFESLKSLQIYYDELKTSVDFSKFYQLLIGNKLDKKKNLDDEQLFLIDKFLQRERVRVEENIEHDYKPIDENSKDKKENEDNIEIQNLEVKSDSNGRQYFLVKKDQFLYKIYSGKMDYYEISTKNFFNFEKFLNRIFNMFQSIDPVFSTSYFKDRFVEALNCKPTFFKSLRDEKKENNFPGPQKYDTNIYGLPESKKEITNIFKGKGKYKENIFINKNGPMFAFKKMNDINRNKKPTQKKSDEIITNSLNLPEEYYKRLYNNFNGFTMGIKEAKLNLRKQRKNMFNDASGDFKEIFRSFDNLLNDKSKERKSRLSKLNKSADNFEKEKRLERIRENNKKVNKIKSKHLYQEQIRMERLLQLSKEAEKETLKLPIIHPTMSRSPRKIMNENYSSGPGFYEVRGNILNPKKGFTFGGRTSVDHSKFSSQKNLIENKRIGHSQEKFTSDFDIINNHPTFPKANRFQDKIQNQLYKGEDPQVFKEKMNEKFKESLNRKKLLKNRDIQKLKEKLKILDKIEKPSEPGPGEYDIRFDFVDEKSPSYTLGGRLERSVANEKLEDHNKLFSLEQSVNYLSKNIQSSLNPLPNFNLVKSNSPVVKFGKSERFEKVKLEKIDQKNKKYVANDLMVQEENYDPNQIYAIGKAKRFKKLMMSDMPGPGEYKIENFAEKLVKKNEKKNILKEKSLQLKKGSSFDQKEALQNNDEEVNNSEES